MDSYQDRMLQAIDEVRKSSFFDVQHDEEGPGGWRTTDPSEIYELMAQDGFALTERVKEAWIPHQFLTLHWHAADPEVELVGDFSVMSMSASARVGVPVLDFAWSEDDYPFLSELTALDDVGYGDKGQMAAMRYRPNETDTEIWYLDTGHSWVRLDLDYRDYLDNLVLTKSIIGWQYLFADVTPDIYEFSRHIDDLTTMLDVFQKLFPHHDYEPLRAPGCASPSESMTRKDL
jgi:hypothetical protein